LFLDDHRGVNIPRDFAECIDPAYWFGISDEDLAILADPDGEFYWETWDMVTESAVAFLPVGAGFDAATMSAMSLAKESDRAGDVAKRDEILAGLPGVRWSLYHDGALWVVPDGMEWDDASEWFVWPSESE
jgi:hypothetical protein